MDPTLSVRNGHSIITMVTRLEVLRTQATRYNIQTSAYAHLAQVEQTASYRPNTAVSCARLEV